MKTFSYSGGDLDSIHIHGTTFLNRNHKITYRSPLWIWRGKDFPDPETSSRLEKLTTCRRNRIRTDFQPAFFLRIARLWR